MRLVVVAALGAVLLGSCADSDASPPTPSDLADLDLSADVTITVDEDGFEPSEVSEAVGTVFLLVNAGDEPHSFTADDHTFDTGLMLPGDETTLVLTEPGSHTFQDLEAPEHQGEIVVSTR